MYESENNTGNNQPEQSAHWALNIEEAELGSGAIGTLTETLYNEVRGERESEKLQRLIQQITVELQATEHETPQLLTDLLRDISLDHPDNQVRMEAYEAMIIALETERKPFNDDDVVVN